MSNSIYDSDLKPTMDVRQSNEYTNKNIAINNLIVLVFITLFGLSYLFCPVENTLHSSLISTFVAAGVLIVLFQWHLHRSTIRNNQNSVWFSTVVNNITDAIITVDCHGNILFISPSTEALSGYTLDELSGKPLSILVPDHLVSGHEADFKKASAIPSNPEYNLRFETLFKHRSGKLINVELSYKESTFQGKRVFISILRDISERLEAEAEKKKLSLAVHNSPSGVMITNFHGDIEYANPKLLQMTGFSQNDVIGKNPRIFSSGEKNRTDYEKMWQTLLSGNSWHDEFRNKRKDGSHYWVIASIAPMYDDRGRLTHFVSVQEDITSLKQANQAMSDAKKIAESALKIRSNFLSNMNHELRTPLNSIIGFAQLLESDPETPLTEEQSECTAQILLSGRHLLALVNEVLDLAKVEAGQYQLTPTNTSALSVIKESIAMTQHLAAQRDITLKFETFPDTLPDIWVDPSKLKQVLINLLSNAIKYNRIGGEVVINIEMIDAARVRINIQDSGVGIPKALQSQVFQPFNRLNMEASGIEGSGIGLALCKQLVELMNGVIGFTSLEGQGATFWVDLPRAESKSPHK